MKLTKKNSSESRRKLLKSIAAGSGAVIAGRSLPEKWTKPVVDSLILPAHAQLSGNVFSCGPATATAVEGVDDDPDNVNIFSDGSTCSLTVTENFPPSGADDIALSLDASATGSTAGTWKTDGSGANWSTSPALGSGTAPGNYSFTATRGSVQYSLTLNVAIVQVDTDPDTFEMTISNVVFTQL